MSTLTLGTTDGGLVTAELDGQPLPVLMHADDVVVTVLGGGRASRTIVRLNVVADRVHIIGDKATLTWGDNTAVVTIDPGAEITICGQGRGWPLDVVCNAVIADRVGTVHL